MLFRAYLPSQAADQPDEFEIHVLDSGQLSETMFHKLRDETKSDPELQQFAESCHDWMAAVQSRDNH